MVRNLTGLLGSVVRRGKDGGQAVATRDICLVCDADLSDSGLYADYRVCHLCRFHYSMTARERIASLADSGTFRETNRSIISLDPLSFSSRVSYRDRLFRDQRRTGLTEALVTGACTVGGSPVMLVVLDFGFMGGTMGCVVGEKVALALEYSAKKGLPTVAVVTSGGARIQEGVLSLMQMAKTTVAATQTTRKGTALHIRAGQPRHGTGLRQLCKPRRHRPGGAGRDHRVLASPASSRRDETVAWGPSPIRRRPTSSTDCSTLWSTGPSCGTSWPFWSISWGPDTG